MTRVLHVIPSVAARYGRPSTAIVPLVAALRMQGIEIEVATTDADGPNHLTRESLPAELGTVHMFPCVGERRKTSPALTDWLNENVRRYDIVQTHSAWNAPTAAACAAARKAAVPYIIRPCGMFSDYTWQKSWLLKRAYWWAVERENARGAAAFHVTSTGEADEIRKLGVKAPAVLIPLGLANDAWDTPVDAGWLRSQCPAAGDRPILLFLSRLHPKKGIVDLLLPAMAALTTPAYLAIVGGPDDHSPGYDQEVERTIDFLGLRDRVAVLGPVPPTRRWAAFDGCDLFVLPSHSENFGLVVPEAMARGKAVIVTTGVQSSDVVIAAAGGEVVQPNATALAASLAIWLTDANRRMMAGESGRKYVREVLTWDRAASSLAALYQRICVKST